MKIREIQLQTHNLKALKKFYSETLELPIVVEREYWFSVKAGASKITFRQTRSQEKPFYHFAFNIPENQLKEAKTWLSSRLTLIKKDGKDEFHFAEWNADAVYFLDPVDNIVELIARHNLKNTSQKPFSSSSLLCVSEIGYPAEDVRLFSRAIKDELNLKLWKGDEKTFAAVGDEEGLFIIVPIGRPWFPLDTPAEDFPLGVDPAE